MSYRREDPSGGLPPPKSHYYRILLDIGDALVTVFNGAIMEVLPEEVAGVSPPHQQFLTALYRIKQAIETAQAGGGGGSGVDQTARQMAKAAQQTADQKLDEQPNGTHPLIDGNGKVAPDYFPYWDFDTNQLDESLAPYPPSTHVFQIPIMQGLVAIVGRLQGILKWIARSAGFATAAQGTKADSAVQPAELDAALDMKQDTLSAEQLDTVNGDPFIAANYSTTAQMTQAIHEALEAAEVTGVITFRGYFSTSEPAQPETGDLWIEGTRPAAPDFTGVTVKQWNGSAWSTTTYTPGIFHLWSDLNEGGKGYYLFPLDQWNQLDFAIDLEPYALKEWVFTQLANYQDILTLEQLAAVNSGITSAILSEIQTFKNRTAGFATSAQGTLADNAQPKLTATGATNLLTAPASAGGQPGTKAIADFAAATHTHDVDNINQFSPGQYSTDLPDPTATKTVKNWIRDILNSLNRLLPKNIVYTPQSYPCWVQLNGSFLYAQEIEFLSVSDFNSSADWNCYARFKYNGSGVIRDMVPGGSTWYGTLQWFKTSLWIPVSIGGCALHIQCGRGIDLSLVTTDPARTPVTIVTM